MRIVLMSKISFEEFVERAEKCHGKGRYDYSMTKDEYICLTKKVHIKCNKCNSILYLTPHQHIRYSCKFCYKNDYVNPRKKWTEETILQESYKYTTIKEFSENSKGAYLAACRLHIMDKLSNLEYSGICLIKRYIYSYTIDYNNKKYVYVGLTCNPQNRHCTHFTRKRKCTIGKFISDNNLPIPEMKIEFSNLSEKEAQIKEYETVNFYLDKGYIVLNKQKTGGLGCSKKLKISKNDIILEANKYNCRSEFKKYNHTYFNRAKEFGMLDDLFPLKRKPNGYYEKMEHILEYAYSCKNYGEFTKNWFLYVKARDNGLIPAIKSFF